MDKRRSQPFQISEEQEFVPGIDTWTFYIRALFLDSRASETFVLLPPICPSERGSSTLGDDAAAASWQCQPSESPGKSFWPSVPKQNKLSPLFPTLSCSFLLKLLRSFFLVYPGVLGHRLLPQCPTASRGFKSPLQCWVKAPPVYPMHQDNYKKAGGREEWAKEGRKRNQIHRCQ